MSYSEHYAQDVLKQALFVCLSVCLSVHPSVHPSINTFKQQLLQSHWGDFSLIKLEYNLSEMFLWWSSTKIVQALMIH